MWVNAPTFEALVPGVLYDCYPAWSMTNLSHRPLLNKVPPSAFCNLGTGMHACVSLNLSFIHWAVEKKDQCRVSQVCYSGAATPSNSLKHFVLLMSLRSNAPWRTLVRSVGPLLISKSDAPSHLTEALVPKQNLPAANLGISSLFLPNTANNLKFSPMRNLIFKGNLTHTCIYHEYLMKPVANVFIEH